MRNLSGITTSAQAAAYAPKRRDTDSSLLLVPAAAPVVPAPMAPMVLLVPAPPATNPVFIVVMTRIGVECCFTEAEDVHDPHISILSLVGRNPLSGKDTQ